MFILILNLLSILNFFLFISSLLLNFSRSKENKVLAFLIVNIILTLVLNLLMYYQMLNNYMFVVYIAYSFEFLWAPAFYYYVLMLFGNIEKFEKNKVLYAIPFFVVVLFFIWFAFQPLNIRVNIISHLQQNDIPWQFVIINYLSVFQYYYFMFLSLRVIYKHKKLEKERSVSVKKFSWLRNVFIAGFILCAIMYFPITIGINLKYYVTIIPALSLVIYFFILYKTINSSLDFSVEISNLIQENSNKKVFIAKSDIKEVITMTKDQENKLILIFEEEKIYLQSELNIQVVADMCETKVHILSSFLNKKYNQSFNDYVNSFRVSEAKRLLEEPQNQKFALDVIGEQSGFQSRSTFYRVFKKYTNYTPLEYIKNHSIDNNEQ